MTRIKEYLRQKKSYQKRCEGMTWTEIASELNYSSHGSARYAAKLYSERVGLEMPLIVRIQLSQFVSAEKRKRAYKLRMKTRLPWVQIAYHCDYDTASGARRAASRHAKEYDLPELPKRSLSRGEIAYSSYADGEEDWNIIALELNTDPKNAKHIAWSHAKHMKKPWPPCN